MLSHTGLKHLYKTNKSKYIEIKNRHLTSNWFGASFDIEIREISHNIRDTMRNRRDKQYRLYPINQLQLFQVNLWRKITLNGNK